MKYGLLMDKLLQSVVSELISMPLSHSIFFTMIDELTVMGQTDLSALTNISIFGGAGKF